jgi:uncharacterized protein YndB with AHSA1/START domain/tRNA A-37 threonylcarbamoyl transferase component Bud32
MSVSDPGATIPREAMAPIGKSGFRPPSAAELNDRISSLDVLELLGQGGMGVVYKGRQPLLDRHVAIKIVRPELLGETGSVERFLREARTLARLRHPYIVTVHDVGKVDQLYYLVMEYVEGQSLRQLLSEKSVAEQDAVEFVPQMAEALQHAHESGVVHRDIKPENVLVDDRGRVRLVDFGLATLFGPAARPSADAELVAGTPGYMAPEQYTSPESVDHRADIYSTGVVFYEMLAGCRPSPDREPPSRKAATDPRLDPIVLRAIEKDRQRRQQAARELHAEVTALSRTPESTIRLVQQVAAPPEKVFAAWADAAGMADWYAPTDDFGPTIADLDFQVGGRYRVAMQSPKRPDPHVVCGEYTRIEEPRLISFTWAWIAPKPDVRETQVTVEFHPRRDGTELVFTHERFRDQGSKQGHTEGWTGCLSRLARKLGS